jgi:VanZ family protein
VNTLVLAAYALFVAVMSLRPADSISLQPWDKLLHIVTYAIFALLARRAIGGDRRFAAASLGIVAYGGLLEVAQSLVPGRVMSGYDFLANALGVVLGALAARAMPRSR